MSRVPKSFEGNAYSGAWRRSTRPRRRPRPPARGTRSSPQRTVARGNGRLSASDVPASVQASPPSPESGCSQVSATEPRRRPGIDSAPQINRAPAGPFPRPIARAVPACRKAEPKGLRVQHAPLGGRHAAAASKPTNEPGIEHQPALIIGNDFTGIGGADL